MPKSCYKLYIKYKTCTSNISKFFNKHGYEGPSFYILVCIVILYICAQVRIQQLCPCPKK